MIARSVVVDTNLIFASLIPKASKIPEVLFESQITFYATNFLISEIYKHFDKLLAAAKLDESDFHIYFNSLFHKIQFIPIDFIATESRQKAYELQWTSV